MSNAKDNPASKMDEAIMKAKADKMAKKDKAKKDRAAAGGTAGAKVGKPSTNPNMHASTKANMPRIMSRAKKG